MNEDDVSAMASDLERPDAFLVKRKAVIEGTVVCIADGSEGLIEAAVQELMYVPREQFGVRLLFSGELHVPSCRYEVVSINGADEFADHAAGIASAERVRWRRRRLCGGNSGSRLRR